MAPAVPVPAYPTFGAQWPGPGRAAPPVALLATFVTAVAAAALLGWDRPGVGWFVAGAVAAASVSVVAVRNHTPRGTGVRSHPGAPADQQPPDLPKPPRQRAMRTVWAVLALALLASGGLRAATWLWWLCLPAACMCGALALSGGRTVRGLTMAVLAVPVATLRALPWAGRALAAARGRGSSSVARMVATLAVSTALLLVFGALLAGADAVFARLVDAVLPTVDGRVISRWTWNFLLVGVGTSAACFLVIRPPAFDGGGAGPAGPGRARSVRRLEWAVPVATLVLLFGSFVGVQATVLFGGRDYVAHTVGVTYAEYARQGFWQLLAVTVLTLLVLAMAARVAGRESAADRICVRLLLGPLAALTLVIVGSALWRMSAYEEAYGYTRLRLLVAVCEAWLGLVFVLVLLAGIRLRAAWLPRAVVSSAVLALVGVVAVNPDLLIAHQNIARYERSQALDLEYLSTLSADAVPALDRLPAGARECVLAPIDAELTALGPDEPREWNLGRWLARRVLSDYQPPVDQDTPCGRLRIRQ